MADILDQSDWYLKKSGRKLAKRWEEGVTSTLLRIAGASGVGSLCEFRDEELRGTRRLPVAGFPKHLIFYRQGEHEIFVLRVVHGARDLEVLFSQRESPKS